jgi:hypothetical protein
MPAWRGSHIQVDQTATGKLVWSRWRCCWCNRELVRGQDIENGLHWRCLQRVGEAEARRLREGRRQADRERYRQDLADGKLEPA